MKKNNLTISILSVVSVLLYSLFSMGGEQEKGCLE